MSLVDTEWLKKEIDKVKIIDSSWHLPQTNRDGYSEYKKGHIKKGSRSGDKLRVGWHWTVCFPMYNVQDTFFLYWTLYKKKCPMPSI